MKKTGKKADRRARAAGETPAAFGHFSLELIENRKLLLCGCRGIRSYSETLAVLQTEKETVTVRGSSLSLCWAGEEKILLVGRFLWVGFGDGPVRGENGREENGWED